jgi:hypothetical protein
LQQRDNWSDHIYDSINWTAYQSAISLYTDSLRTFVIKLSHGWLPVGVRERRCGAATDICTQCIQPVTVPYLYLCHSRATWHDQLIFQLSDTLSTHPLQPTSSASLYIQNWFLTGDTNKPDNPDPIIQIGWFQGLKGYLSQQWSTTQALFFRAHGF